VCARARARGERERERERSFIILSMNEIILYMHIYDIHIYDKFTYASCLEFEAK